MNLKRNEAERRREFMKEIILRNPKLSAAKLNEFARKEFGSMLRTSTIYQLKEELGFDRLGNLRVPHQAQGAEPAAGDQVPVTRARNAGETTRGVFPLLISLATTERPVEMAEKLLKRLEDNGIVHLKITGSGASWIVVEPVT